MSDATRAGTVGHGARLPWADLLLSAIACVGWALTGMAVVAALGLHLLGADAAGSLGPMTAAAVALGAGGSVTPSGDVSAFGLKGAQAHTALQIAPLGVSLAGALLLSWFFLRSVRAAGAGITPGELLARAGSVVALFVAALGWPSWAGHDVVTIDGDALSLDRLPDGGRGGGSGHVSVPGLGGLGDIGGLVHAKAALGFRVDTAPTLLGGLGWSAGVLLVALLASRRTPLPHGWQALRRTVRPAVSAVVTVALVGVAAGLAAAAYAAIGDPHPGRVAGAALLGAPNGVWLALPLGLFVPWDGRATGPLARFLPDPLDRILATHPDRPVTLGRLADLDGRVWLLAVAAALLMLLAGVLTAVRTPVEVPGGRPGSAARAPVGGDKAPPAVGGRGRWGFAGRCALRLGLATALALPSLAWLTDLSVNASLSVFGFDAFGAGLELHGRLGTAVLLGAAWGAAAGAAGALLAVATGAAGRRAGPVGSAAAWPPDVRGPADASGPAGPPGLEGSRSAGPPGPEGAQDAYDSGSGPYDSVDPRGSKGSGAGRFAGPRGPYSPTPSYRPPDPATNPYLRLPGGPRPPEEAPLAPDDPSREPGRNRRSGPAARPPRPPAAPGDLSGAPTVVGPLTPPPRPPARRPRPRPKQWPPPAPDDGPPPPPPPPRRPPGRAGPSAARRGPRPPDTPPPPPPPPPSPPPRSPGGPRPPGK
ncbi:streptophobe family protein [Streptomyces mexicanus]|uniref:streptophobe family protein n=1 Tax=Streptomyces mexicanus TaxID=178566 RepID=UPI00368E3FF2